MIKKEKINKKTAGLLIGLMAGTCILTGCGSSEKTLETKEAFMPTASVYNTVGDMGDYFAPEEAAFDYDFESEQGLTDNGAGMRNPKDTTAATNRKLIRRVTLNVETEDFDGLLPALDSEISRLGGYIESENTYNGSAYSEYRDMRNATIVVRIPDDKLDEFVESVSGKSNITSKTTSTEDVTLQYVDTEGRKKMYEAELESLTALLENAETIEDITYLTERISEVRFELENQASILRTYDNLVDYATVSIYVNEVEIYTPVETPAQTDGERIAEGFKASLNNVISSIKEGFISFLIKSPYIIKGLLTFAIIVGIIWLAIALTVKAIKRKDAKNKAKKAGAADKAVTDNAATENAAEDKTDSVKEESTDAKAEN